MQKAILSRYVGEVKPKERTSTLLEISAFWSVIVVKPFNSRSHSTLLRLSACSTVILSIELILPKSAFKYSSLVSSIVFWDQYYYDHIQHQTIKIRRIFI